MADHCNVVIEAHDEDAAKVKLMKRYPGCTVLSVTEKSGSKQ